MKEGKIPLIYTGKYPGQQGYQYVFWMLAGFSAIGAVAAFIYYQLYKK